MQRVLSAFYCTWFRDTDNIVIFLVCEQSMAILTCRHWFWWKVGWDGPITWKGCNVI